MKKHGSFTAAEQLLEVQGIGKATLEKKPRSYRVLMLLFLYEKRNSDIPLFLFFEQKIYQNLQNIKFFWNKSGISCNGFIRE